MIEVIYKSKKNNKKIAKAIADELQVDAKNIKQVQDVKADILFLGCPKFLKIKALPLHENTGP